MSDQTSLLRQRMIAATTALLLTVPSAHAGGGAVIGKVAGDLSDRFGKAVNPTVPPKTPEPTLEYKPPEPAPGGDVTWSIGQVSGQTGPLESLRGGFNRNAADKPASSALTDLFNHARRALD